MPLFSLALSATEKLENKLSNFVSMQADFEEYVIASKTKEKIREIKGHIAVSRPGKFRWEVMSPEKKLILADGKYFWVYDVNLKQATKQKIDYRVLKTPAFLLSGSGANLKEAFTVKEVPLKDQEPSEIISFELHPKANETSYRWIKLYFKKNILISMQILDHFDQIAVIDFKDIELNAPLSLQLFHFQPKKDVDILNAD